MYSRLLVILTFLDSIIAEKIIELRDLKFLNGFETCRNTLFLFNTSFYPDPHHGNSNLTTVSIFTSGEIIAKQQTDFRKYLLCQTISFVYTDLFNSNQHFQIFSTAKQITATIIEFTPFALKTWVRSSIQLLPRYIFLISTNQPVANMLDFAKSPLHPLWNQAMKSSFFEVIGTLDNNVISFNNPQFYFICHHCNVWKYKWHPTFNMMTPDYPNLARSPVTPGISNRHHLDQAESQVTRDGQNLT